MSMDKPLPLRILEAIQADGLVPGSHLTAQALANRFQVSRSPINQALALLASKGVLRREENRGYFLAKALQDDGARWQRRLGLAATDPVAAAYFRLADDLLKGELPNEVSESFIKSRYELTAAQLKAVLQRVALEGWASRKPGYGWTFSTMLTTSESLLQSYRLRLALEPVALMEPGYRLCADVLARCRAAEHHLLDGGIETDTPDQLHERGVRFHESLVEASGNPFFIDTIRRVNRVRRLISYRSMQDRQRYAEHCHQHLQVLDLIARGKQADAADALRKHLQRTLENHQKIRRILRA